MFFFYGVHPKGTTGKWCTTYPNDGAKERRTYPNDGAKERRTCPNEGTVGQRDDGTKERRPYHSEGTTVLLRWTSRYGVRQLGPQVR